MNGNQPIYIEKGSYSNDISIQLEDICALNLRLIGVSSILTLQPSEINFSIGDNMKQFRLTVDEEVVEEEVYFEWSIIGDFEIPTYTPILKTQVFLTQKKNLPIQIGNINDIPLGGSSLPIKISTQFSPNFGIVLRLYVDPISDYVKFNTTEISFGAGQLEDYFEISSTTTDSKGLVSGSISVELKGLNSQLYELQQTQYSYKIIEKDTSSPEILEIVLQSVTQTSAQIYFSTNKLAIAYCMNSLKNTETPKFDDMLKNIAEESTKS